MFLSMTKPTIRSNLSALAKHLSPWVVGCAFLFPALSLAQTWVGCADTREAALMLAQSAMVEDIGQRETFGDERVQNDHYTTRIRENAETVTDKPVKVVSEYRSNGKLCVEIEP